MNNRSALLLLVLPMVVGWILGCDERQTIDEVRRTKPSFKVWKEEIFYDDDGGIRVHTCYSKDSTSVWLRTCIPADSACFIQERRGRKDLYQETIQNDGRVFITFIINDGSNEPPVYKSLSFYPSGQIEWEGIEAHVVGHPASNCDSPPDFHLHSDSVLQYRMGGVWVSMKEQVKTGTWKYYHENGRLKMIEDYDTVYGQCRERINDDAIGLHLAYLVSTIPILQGQRIAFDKNGKMIIKEFWEKGKLVSENALD
jgi:antitoxin component YwqK of YwqJK toxin-antitoxin module